MKKMKKWWLIPGGVVAVALLATTTYANNPIKILVDGKLLHPSVQPSMVNNRVVAPVRDVAESLGAQATWSGQTNTVQIQSANATDTKMQIEQLERALAPQSPQDAVNEWARGLQTRNGALQYAVMTDDLRAKNYDSFSKLNWVTGVSSPWISNQSVIKSQQVKDTEWQFNVQFESMTSTGMSGLNITQVTVDQINKNWYVSDLKVLSSNDAILKQSATLPDGTPLSEMPSSYNNLNMVTMRVLSATVTGQTNEDILSPINFYGGGTILQQEQVNLPVGAAKLALVQPKTVSSDVKPQNMYYMTVTRDYPNRDDMKLVYTIMATFTGDQANAKQDLLKIAQTWKLPQ